MTNENKFDEMEGTPLSDEMLDDVVGGAIHQNAKGEWEVINDADHQVVKSFGSRSAAIMYAKKKGYGTQVI